MMPTFFRDGLFQGKVALITGGGTGIGRGITEGLALLGAETAIMSRKAEHLGPTAADISARHGRECLPVVADVRHPEQVNAAVSQVKAELGRIDFLVNAAAGNFFCPSAELSPNGFGTVVDIDTKGTWNVCRAVFDAGLGKTGGAIVNISATLHYGGTPGQAHVAAAKAAVDALLPCCSESNGDRSGSASTVSLPARSETQKVPAGCSPVKRRRCSEAQFRRAGSERSTIS